MATGHSTTIDAKTLETASDIQLFDREGAKVRFGDIYADEKTIIVFIRTCILRCQIHFLAKLISVIPQGTSSVG
jgi:hypothetical protein